MTRHRAEVLAAFVAGVLLALAVVVPVQAGLGNCRPAWKCAPSTPGATASRTSSPTTAPTVAPTSSAGPTPAPTAQTPPSGVYGPAIAADGKDNRWIGGTNPGREVAHRWRSTGGQLTSYAFNQRFGADGSGYSSGTGGTIELSLYRCDPIPTGTALSTITFHPSNPHTQAETKTPIAWSANVPAGLVCIAARNVDAQSTTNWMSANELWVPGSDVDAPRQPAFPDDSLAVLSRNEFSSSWSVKANNTPVFDVAFADGHHEGQAYYERFVSPNEVVMGPGDKVRERFTPTTTLNLSAVWFRVQRQSGSTLTVTLAGQTCSTSISQVPVERFAVDVWAGGKWVACPISATLPANLEQSATFRSDGSLRVAPIREAYGEGQPFWGSRQFLDGVAEKSIAGGSWQPMYFGGVADLQFYGVVQ